MGGPNNAPDVYDRLARAALRLTWWIVPGPLGEDFTTELDAEYLERRAGSGPLPALLWLWGQVCSWNTLQLRGGVGNAARRSHGRSGPSRAMSDGWWQDCRHAVRTLLRSPGFATTVVLTFALAVGANVAVFTVINGVLLRPLPYPQPDQIVSVNRKLILADTSVIYDRAVSYPDYRDWAQEVTTLEHLAVYRPVRETFFGAEHAAEWFGFEVSPELFTTLGIQAVLGRTFADGVDPSLDGEGIVLSHQLWSTTFAGDSGIIGQSIRFEDRTMSVIGVMPPGFYFPTRGDQFWTILRSVRWLQMRGSAGLGAIARLAPDVTLDQAQREMALLVERTDALPDALSEADGVRLVRYHEVYVGHTRRLFLLLSAAVLVVLLVACANIASLGVTRITARAREFAIRSAVGAGAWRIMRLMLTESVILAAIGAGVGVGIAVGTVHILGAIVPSDLPRGDDIRVDAAALVFATVIAGLSGTAYGLAPALRASRYTASTGLQSRAHTGAIDRHRTIRWLVVCQVGCSQVLIVLAGLLLHSFAELSAIEPGFDAEHTLTMRLVLPRDPYGSTEQVLSFHESVLGSLRAIPGVETAGLTSHLPFSPSDRRIAYWLDDAESFELTADTFNGHMEVISQDYLTTMHIPILAGRDFRPDDGSDVVLINEHMAELHWPSTNPIGGRLRIPGRGGERVQVTVVGVVGSVLKRGLDEDVRPVIYVSFGSPNTDSPQFVTGREVYLAIRTLGAPDALAESALRAVREMNPNVVVTNVRSTDGLLADSIAEPRFRTVLLSAFAAVAVMVALVGVYGAMSFGVAQRRSELGVRMALGADASVVMRQVLRSGIVLILTGVAGGTLIALVVSSLISDMLFHVTPTDPSTFVVVSLLLLGVGAAACYIPARRAGRVDPLTVLSE